MEGYEEYLRAPPVMNWACCSALAGKESQPVVVEAPTNITRLGSWTTSPKGRGGTACWPHLSSRAVEVFLATTREGGWPALTGPYWMGPASGHLLRRPGTAGEEAPGICPPHLHLCPICSVTAISHEDSARPNAGGVSCKNTHATRDTRCGVQDIRPQPKKNQHDRTAAPLLQVRHRQERQHLCPCEKFDRIQLAHGALHAPSTTFQGVKKTGPDDMDLCLAQPGRVPTATNLAFVSPGSSSHLRSRCPCSRRMGGATAVTGGRAGALDWGMTRRLSPPLCSRVERRMRGARAGRSLGSDFLSPYIYLEEGEAATPSREARFEFKGDSGGAGTWEKTGTLLLAAPVWQAAVMLVNRRVGP